MTAESFSASHSLVKRFSVPSKTMVPNGYYRSKLFVVPFDTNPLLAAASPIFSFLERLTISSQLPPIDEVRKNLEHELNAFYSQISGKTYADEIIIVSNYLLCATMDELIGKNYTRIYDKAPEFKAFTPLSFDEEGPENRFFDIVNYIKKQTNQYLDLVELAYYCLTTGFEGQYHLRADGRQTLDNLIEDLYQLIQKNRVNKPIQLFQAPSSQIEEPPRKNYKYFFSSALVAVAVISSVYFVGHLLVENKAKTVLQGHATLARMEQQ